jgi:hypothetical protein
MPSALNFLCVAMELTEDLQHEESTDCYNHSAGAFLEKFQLVMEIGRVVSGFAL